MNHAKHSTTPSDAFLLPVKTSEAACLINDMVYLHLKQSNNACLFIFDDSSQVSVSELILLARSKWFRNNHPNVYTESGQLQVEQLENSLLHFKVRFVKQETFLELGKNFLFIC